jgi:acyl-CoA reductase-like NAD-dependent aldehyde dehydrogenase
MGAIINRKQFDRVCGYITTACSRQAPASCSAVFRRKEGPLAGGYFVQPTVFADVSNDWRIAREEIFGPVMVAIPWKDEADAIRMANDSHYGLAAYVWTRDISKAINTAHAIESGWVQINQGWASSPVSRTAVTSRAAWVASIRSKECSTVIRNGRASPSICSGNADLNVGLSRESLLSSARR